MWIDSHAHLDAPEFAADRAQVQRQTRAAAVAHCFIPAVERANWDTVRALAHAQGDSYGLGIHPLYVPQAEVADLQALDAALGARTGINRMGAAWVPMDEALAQVVLDLSGRPYAVVHAEWHTPTIGAVPTSLLAHFLESLAVTLRANLHARVAYGRDDHHQAEALFKALGRALLQAVQLEPRRQGVLPSSKGKL